jgi:hypothetical protein
MFSNSVNTAFIAFEAFVLISASLRHLMLIFPFFQNQNLSGVNAPRIPLILSLRLLVDENACWFLVIESLYGQRNINPGQLAQYQDIRWPGEDVS